MCKYQNLKTNIANYMKRKPNTVNKGFVTGQIGILYNFELSGLEYIKNKIDIAELCVHICLLHTSLKLCNGPQLLASNFLL